jgi:hypothetical protein
MIHGARRGFMPPASAGDIVPNTFSYHLTRAASSPTAARAGQRRDPGRPGNTEQQSTD